MPHRMTEIKPDQLITHEECKKMIESAIDRHNKNASLISAALGTILLIFYAHGLFAVLENFK